MPKEMSRPLRGNRSGDRRNSEKEDIMTFFEQELRKLFDHDAVFQNTRFVGNACYGRLTDSIRVKIRFSTCGYADNYEALQITLLNRNEGPIDSMMLHFRDLWGKKPTSNPNFKDGVVPHLLADRGKVDWYVYHPGKTDYRQLAEAVGTYLSVFQEPVQEQLQGQNMC